MIKYFIYKKVEAEQMLVYVRNYNNKQEKCIYNSATVYNRKPSRNWNLWDNNTIAEERNQYPKWNVSQIAKCNIEKEIFLEQI